MGPIWSTFTAPDGRSYSQIEISQRPDWFHFEQVAHILIAGLRARWTERLDGLDQRYWDLQMHGGQLMLHLDHYLGITLYPTAGAAADDESLALLRAAFELLDKTVAA